MNYLGHPFVCKEIFEDFNQYHLVGSWLPDLWPFIDHKVLTYDNWHEGGEKMLRFLDHKYPEIKGIGLGMMAHGYTYGADRFNREIEERYADQRDEMTKKIVSATPNLVTQPKGLEGRFHNFLWWGVDVQLLRNEPSFIKQIQNLTTDIDRSELSGLIAEMTNKDRIEIDRLLSQLLDPLSAQKLSNIRGLAYIWQQVAKGLPERDQVLVPQCVDAFEYCADLVADECEDIVELVVDGVRQ